MLCLSSLVIKQLFYPSCTKKRMVKELFDKQCLQHLSTLKLSRYNNHPILFSIHIVYYTILIHTNF